MTESLGAAETVGTAKAPGGVVKARSSAIFVVTALGAFMASLDRTTAL